MNNAAFESVAKIPLTVFGGAVTEMAPSDLPEGASPFNQDCDFLPGSVFSRGGRQNVIVFAGLFSEQLTGVAQSLPGSGTSWTTPNNATRNIPGTYAMVGLGGSPASLVQSAARYQDHNNGTSTTISMTNTAGDFLLAVYDPGAGGGSPGTAISDTLGNAWVLINHFVNLGNHQIFVWYVLACQGGANTITFTSNNVGAQLGQAAHVYEVSGVAAIDQFNGTVDASTAQITTGVPNTFVLGVNMMLFTGQVNYTPGAGWTLNAADFGQVNGPGVDDSTISEFQTVVQAGTVVMATSSPAQVSGQGVSFIISLQSATGGLNVSNPLQATNFPFAISAADTILGLQVEVSGHQTVLTPDAILTATLVLPSGQLSPTSITFQLPSIDAQTVVGTIMQSWGVPLTPALFNSPNFGVQIVAQCAGELVTFDIYAVKLKAWLSPNPPQNFDYLKTFEQTAGTFTLALDAGGTLWQEDAVNAPGVLSAITTSILPNTFAKSVTFENVEYIAFSNLLQGTDLPRQWTGSNFDKIAQSGPAAAPFFSTTANGAKVLSITQASPFLLPQFGGGGANNWLLVSAGPSAHGTFGTPSAPGNVMTIILASNVVAPTAIQIGSNIQISGFPTINGFTVNNDPTGVTNPAFYTVTSVGAAIPGQNSYDWITFTVPFTTFFNQQTPANCSIQGTLATMTMSAQVPYLEVGNQFTLTGVSPAGWNNTFTVQQTPNAGVYSITQTSLTANVAQYVFTLVSGALPQVGQFITVTGTLNGNGVFNIVNAVILSVTANSFSVSIVSSGNINSAPENNSFGSVYGTVFVFDPAGVVTNPIIGNAGATGSLATTGVIGVGIRNAVCIFLTRNNSLTPPSPFATFNVTLTATAIVASSIPIGPPNTIARIIAFTGAGGSNYFYIPLPVTVQSNGQNVTYTATQINDNVTTQATFSFPDNLLVNSTAIDVTGNNLFACVDLPSCRGFLTYADRLIAIGVNTKVFNLLNLSFDGGIGVQNLQQLATQPQVVSFPLGWTVDPVNGAGGQLVVSPLFGNAFYIKNASGVTQAKYGMITQPAYVTQLGTPIFFANNGYSVRVAARCPSGVQTGNLVVDLFSATLNQIFGSFAIPLSSMSSNYQIFTGTLLAGNGFATNVPKDLVYRIYTTAIPNGGDVEIDRTEPFLTAQPTFSTQFWASYAGNQELFDTQTGPFGPQQNQERENGGLVLFDTLYMLKENSWFSTSDNGVTEPFKWNWRTVSDKIGTIGIHSYDYGEAWAVTACRSGIYYFDGGEPIKISQEISSLWELINWKFGHTIWLRNDVANKTIKVGIPIPTPNVYMPEMPANANPTSPNVVLNLSYRELNTGAALATVGPIRSTFSGRLMSPEPARKWSFWNISAPCGELIDRGNNSKVLWLGSGYSDSKIFQINPAQLHDDGNAINSFYLTHGYPKPEIAAAQGIDLLRYVFDLMFLLTSGTGTLNIYAYPEDPQNLPYLLDNLPLGAVTAGNSEVPVNLTGNRWFLRVGTNAVGASWKLSTVIGIFTEDPWAPMRGTSQGAL